MQMQKKTYSFEFSGENQTLGNCTFPYQISYKGELTDSGNELNEESLKLFSHILGHKFYKYSNCYGVYIPSEIKFVSAINPVTIKNKEYVGIQYEGYKLDGELYPALSPDYALITLNTYKSFGSITFDEPDGCTEW